MRSSAGFFLPSLPFHEGDPSSSRPRPSNGGGTAYPTQTRLTLPPGHSLPLRPRRLRPLFTSRPSLPPSSYLSSFADLRSNHHAVRHHGSRQRTVPRCQCGGWVPDLGDPVDGCHGGPSQAKCMEGGWRMVPVCFFCCHGANFGGYPVATTQQTLGGGVRLTKQQIWGVGICICTSGLAWRRRINFCLWPRGLL